MCYNMPVPDMMLLSLGAAANLGLPVALQSGWGPMAPWPMPVKPQSSASALHSCNQPMFVAFGCAKQPAAFGCAQQPAALARASSGTNMLPHAPTLVVEQAGLAAAAQCAVTGAEVEVNPVVGGR